METTIYLSNHNIQVIEGKYDKKLNKIIVNDVQEYPLHQGSMINGTIINEEDVKNNLQFVSASGVKKARLLIDSGKIITKSIMTPKMKHSELQQVVEDELFELKGGASNLIYDYTIISDKATESGALSIMAYGVERSLVETYVNLFEECGITIQSIDTSSNAVGKLVEAIPALNLKSFVVSVIDGSDIKSNLFVDCKSVFSSRTRLFSDRGSSAFNTELATNLNQLIQFKNASYKDVELNTIYFSGLNPNEEEIIFDYLKENININAHRFENFDFIIDESSEHNLQTHLFLYPIAALIRDVYNRKKKDINFLSVYKYKDSFIEKHLKEIQKIIPLIILCVVFIFTFVTLKLQINSIDSKIDDYKDKIAEINKQNTNAEDIEKNEENNAIQQKITDLNKVNTNLASFPKISQNVITSINNSIAGATIQSFSFNQEDGKISLSLRTDNVTNTQNIIRNLKASGYFESVKYTGYTEGEESTEDDSIDTSIIDSTVENANLNKITSSYYSMDVVCILKVGV